MAKVCLQCKSVQPDELEFCPLDGGHLQEAPPGATVSGSYPAEPQSSAAPEAPAGISPPPPPSGRMRRPPPGAVGPAVQAGAGPEPEEAVRHRPTMLAAGSLADLVAEAQHPPAAANHVDVPVLPPPGAAQRPSSAQPRATAPVGKISAAARADSNVAVAIPALPPGAKSTLADALRRGPMPVEQAVARIGLIAEAVAAQRQAHHGQLTPWHVQFDSEDASGRPRIGSADLAVDPSYAGLYRAPELEHADDPSSNSAYVEVYALGCMLFEAIAGRPPFQGATPAELVKRHASAAAPAVRMVRRECDLPPSLELEIQRALKKRQGDRHASATAFAMAIRASNRDDDRSTMALNTQDSALLNQLLNGAAGAKAGAGSTGPGAPVVGGAAAGPVAPAGKTGSVAPAAAPAKASNGLLIAALVAILVLGAGLVYVLTQEDEPAPAPPAAPAKAPVAPAPAPDVVAEVDAVDTVDVEDIVDIVDVTEEIDVGEPEEVAPEAPTKVRPKTKIGPKTPGETPVKVEEKKRDGGPAVF